MKQEDGIIHGHAQLQYGSQSFRNIGDLTEDDIGPKVIDDWEDQSHHKDEWNGVKLHAHPEHRNAGRDRNQNIVRHLLINNGFGILQDY